MTETPTTLAGNALGLQESIIMGVAGTAPAFSLAATTATLVAAVGALAPASLLSCGLIMFGITLTFMYFNRIKPNAGASFIWVGEIFHPVLGFFAGWALLVASAVFMVSGTVPAATATLALVAPDLEATPAQVMAVAVLWFSLVTAVVLKGIKLTSYTQIVMTVFEISVLLVIIVAAAVQFSANPAHHLDLASFLLIGFTPTLFTTGALTALFFFWGWDVTVNLNEETRDGRHRAGIGAVTATAVSLLVFVAFVLVALLALSDDEIQNSGTNLVFAIAEKLFPKPWSYAAIIAVMLSTMGTIETSILQFTRTLFAKSRSGCFHPRFADLHPSWRTPWLATITIGLIGLILIVLSSFSPTVNDIIKDSVNALGFQVSFYYGLTGFACAWHCRKEAATSPRVFLLYLLWPASSAAFLWFVALYSVQSFDLVTNIVGIGGLALGVIPLLLGGRAAATQSA